MSDLKNTPPSEDEGYHSPSLSRTVSGGPEDLQASPPQSLLFGGTQSSDFTETEKIVKNVLQELLTSQKVEEYSPHSVQATLLRCVNSFREDHRDELQTMVKGLQGQEENSRLEVFKKISFELFEGHKRAVTWQRIIALLAFATELLSLFQTNSSAGSRSSLHSRIEIFVVSIVGPFVSEKGGWYSLQEEFPEDKSSASRGWSMLQVGALVGLATATTLRILS